MATVSDPAPAVGVVIPAIDEADCVGALLADLAAQVGVVPDIVVADGGSLDATVAVARAGGARVVHGAAGRARQMNAGAAALDTAWVVFLHADSRLTHSRQLAEALGLLCRGNEIHVAGHFALCFRRDRDRFLYRYMEAKTATGRRHTINGDQGFILHADLLALVGGFDTRLPFLEDQRMAAAVSRFGRWQLCPHVVTTSARRFEAEGPATRYALMGLIMSMHLAGIDQFFERAPCVYARQRHTERLSLAPYIGLLASLARTCGWRAGARACWRIAGIAVGEGWQLAFALDVACEPVLGAHRRRFLGLYDHGGRWLIDNPLMQAIVAMMLPLLIFGPMRLWYRLRAKRFHRPP